MATHSTLSRSTRLLLESGALEADAVSRRVGARDLVLSRALCRFRHYRAPQNLTSSQLAKAARVFAEAHAPFANTGMLILRSLNGAGIWYWDRAKLAVHEPVGQVSPESVWREAGAGWRVVTCVEGFEAQYWQEQRLLASTWRRQAFTAAQWNAFALSVEGPTEAPPVEPPAPVALALIDGTWRGKIIKEPLGWRDAEKVGVTVAICGAAVAALFAGQALHSDQIANREQARAETIEQTFREDRDIARALEQRRLVNAYAAVTRHPQVLIAATEAHEVLSRFGLRASTWRANEEGLSVIVDASISDAPVRDVVAAIEEAPHLCNAVPEIAGLGRFEIRADINDCPAGGA
ncbi:MAG: hypothetical protein ABL871_18480 [Terricaulis sp.]